MRPLFTLIASILFIGSITGCAYHYHDRDRCDRGYSRVERSDRYGGYRDYSNHHSRYRCD